ncbi:hypothetical protein ACIPM5_36865 [Streptomyces microflavus]|uniref:hypothetical protein n=1 Tax=Streptomyces microflavus TaxID=1919 RepID=UPI0034243890
MHAAPDAAAPEGIRTIVPPEFESIMIAAKVPARAGWREELGRGSMSSARLGGADGCIKLMQHVRLAKLGDMVLAEENAHGQR